MQESGPLYTSWQSARAQSGLLRRPLSISLGGGGWVMTPLTPPGYGPGYNEFVGIDYAHVAN